MTWARATTATTCGLCGGEIPRGDLVALLSRAKLRRCVTCAGRCPWPNLPLLPEPQREASRIVPTERGPERLVSGERRAWFEAWAQQRKGAA